MDHVMLKIEQYYDIYFESFIEFHIKYGHKNLSDNPLYPELRILTDSINLYRKFLDLPVIKLSTEVKSELERRNK